MISKLPTVRHSGLQYQGAGTLALHIHYTRPLGPKEQAFLLGALGAYVLNEKGPVFEPDFDGAIVLLTPTSDQALDDAAYKRAARHFGCVLNDGDLPFMGPGQCPISSTEGDAGPPIVVQRMPLLRH